MAHNTATTGARTTCAISASWEPHWGALHPARDIHGMSPVPAIGAVASCLLRDSGRLRAVLVLKTIGWEARSHGTPTQFQGARGRSTRWYGCRPTGTQPSSGAWPVSGSPAEHGGSRTIRTGWPRKTRSWPVSGRGSTWTCWWLVLLRSLSTKALNLSWRRRSPGSGRCQGQGSLTVSSRTDRTVPDHDTYAGHGPADTDSGALAGRFPLIYGSEGWGFESLRARHRNRRQQRCPGTATAPRSWLATVGQARRQGDLEAGQALLSQAEARYASVLTRLRTELGLPGYGSAARSRRPGRGSPVCHGFSPVVIPRPAGWPADASVPGYWWPAGPSTNRRARVRPRLPGTQL